MKKINRSMHIMRLVMGLFIVMAFTACAAPEDGHTEDGHTEDAHEEESGQAHEGEELVSLSTAELEEFGVVLDVANAGTLSVQLTLPGEVKVNQDKFAHIVPRIPGVVHSANKSAGDAVRTGDVLAVLDSRELADIKSEYLANIERLSLADAAFQREERLYDKKISSEQEFLEARQAMSEAQIALRSSRQKLLALGFNQQYITSLPEQPEHALVHYEITAPISGTVIEKHINQGESLTGDADAFAVADLRTVWVDLSVFQKDMDLVFEGQSVDIVTTGGQLRTKGEIRYVRPIVGEETRTAIARIVLENTDGRWKPGLFVSGQVAIDEVMASLMVPKSALIKMDEGHVIFVQEDEGFAPRAVTTSRENDTHIEITSGLEVGERYVASGGFALKAELGKDEIGEGHAH